MINITPEQTWEQAKKLFFGDNCPKEIEDMVKKGFDESIDEDEKWMKISGMLSVFKSRMSKQ